MLKGRGGKKTATEKAGRKVRVVSDASSCISQCLAKYIHTTFMSWCVALRSRFLYVVYIYVFSQIYERLLM